MIGKGFIELLIAVCVPIAGAVGYVHGTFATSSKVERVEKRIDTMETAILRTDKLMCKMAIRQKLNSAEEICTEPKGDL